MAWGYWSAHSLAPTRSTRHGRSLSPAPTIQSRSREQSLERDRREMEQSVCPTPSRSSVCPTPAPAPGTAAASESCSPQHEFGYRTRGERSTLPRGKSSDSVDWIPERNTLPRGKCEGEPGWGGEQRPLSQGERCALSRSMKSGSEGEWCPACSSSSRVSFQSVKEGRGSSTEGGKSLQDSRNILSSSLPTPPPPPFQASFSQPSLSREGGRGGGPEIMETFSLKRNREERTSRQNTRNSYSSHESHKSSVSHRSSEEENNDSGCRTDSTGRREAGKRTSCHTRTPSSERQFESLSEGCSKEGSSDGYQCRYPSCPSREPGRLSSVRVKPSRESYASEDSRSYRHSSTGSAEDEKKPLDKSYHTATGRNNVFSDETDSHKEWKTLRDKDCKKLRNVEKISFNGAQIWRERGQTRGRIYSGTDSRRSLRSLTPDNDSISFHESLGRELNRRRRHRRRSASCSSRCQEAEGEEEEDVVRLDSANSNHSITGPSSRNSSSKSEKSSSRSSRSPSVEFSKKGCGSLQCRGRQSLR